MANTGPSTCFVSCGSVTITAISMMRSRSGKSPVISRSIQIRFASSAARSVSVMANRKRRSGRTPTLSRMSSWSWTLIFAAALVASLVLRAWLASRQVRHVARHRETVPEPFRATVDLAAHRKAASYTLAKIRLGQWQMVFGAVVLLGWTLFGGLDALNALLGDAIAPRWGGLTYEVALVAAVVGIELVLN